MSRCCTQQKGSLGHALFTGAVLAALGLALASPGWAQPASAAQAVELARKGHTAEALAAMEKLYAVDPDNKAIFHDYLTVLAWAGQDARVAEIATRLSPQAAPGYALEAAAMSARRRGDYLQAEYLYRFGSQRFPGDLDFPNGLVLTLADAGQAQAAIELARQFELSYPDEPSLLLAKGYALEAGRDFFTALQVYDQVLASHPGNRLARARRLLALDSLGASHLAVDLAREDPGLLSTEEWQRLLNNQGAFAVRWGDLPPEDETKRFVQTDRALELLDRNLAELDRTRPAARAFELRTRFDRLVALRNRFRMKAVIKEYEALRRDEVVFPSYVLSAAADAYLYRQQPEQAQALHQQILDRQPDDFDAQLALFYTLIELEDFASAYTLIDSMDQAQPPWLIHRRGDGRHLARPNPHKLTAASTAAMARFYGDQYAEAEKRFTALHETAPANVDIIRELGNVYAARGWPRQAQQIYALGLPLAPRHKGLQTGLAQSYLERREYRLAELASSRLNALYPEDSQVRRLYRGWKIHNKHELRLSAGHQDNSGTTQGTREMLLEGVLFSRPLDYHYRMFVSSRYAFAAFAEGNEIYRRHGVGVEYRRPDLQAAAELTYNVDGGDELGGRLSFLWEQDDRWSVPGNVERFSRDTPLRALRDNITADSADLGVSYRASELRSVRLKAQVMDFSDGNFRRSLAASLEQRLLTLPKFKLGGIVDLYTSANSRNDTIYFNPGHDFSAALTLDSLHRLYRRYDRVFSHRLALTLGNYWQKDFADDYLAGAAYEHIWETADRFELVYGFSRFRRVYDGLPEYQNHFYSRLNWRF
jgi:biofilm PGA synthesis protein PgaA